MKNQNNHRVYLFIYVRRAVFFYFFLFCKIKVVIFSIFFFKEKKKYVFFPSRRFCAVATHHIPENEGTDRRWMVDGGKELWTTSTTQLLWSFMSLMQHRTESERKARNIFWCVVFSPPSNKTITELLALWLRNSGHCMSVQNLKHESCRMHHRETLAAWTFGVVDPTSFSSCFKSESLVSKTFTLEYSSKNICLQCYIIEASIKLLLK